MKQRARFRYTPDAFTLALMALLSVAAIWLIFVEVTGARGVLAERVFGLALGLFLGNTMRLLIGTPNRS